MNGGTKISGVRVEMSELSVSAGRKTEPPANEKAQKINVKTGEQSSQKESGLKDPAGNAVSARSGTVEKGNIPGQNHAAAFSQKTAKISPQKNSSAAPYSSLSNAAAKNPPQSAGAGFSPQQSAAVQISQNASGTPGETAVSAGEIFKQTAAGLGFPPDTLSVTLLAFSRFFSLSPSRPLLEKLRRELLSLKTLPSGGSKEKSALEGEALAAAAAFDKGITLSGPALEHYARFFSSPPPATEKKNPDDGRRPGSEEVPRAEELQAIAEGEIPKDSLLDFMNSLPGKNGQYWSVFSFKIKVRGIEFSVIIRILKREPIFDEDGGHLIADIVSQKKRWRCFLEKKAGKFRADIRVYPGENSGSGGFGRKGAALSAGALASLKKDAERFFAEKGGNIRFEEILVRDGDGLPSWAEELRDSRLPSINEEV